MKNAMNRRRMLATLGGLSAALLAGAMPARADDDRPRSSTSGPVPLPVTGVKGKVVIVGGGMAGGTLAKYLRLWGGAGIDVTLVERESAYTSNIL